MIKRIIFFTLITAFSFQELYSANIQNPEDLLNNASDTLIFAVPVFAFGMTFGETGTEGTWQFAKVFGTSLGITMILRVTVDETRPNGGSLSFPSGHVANMVCGAEFLRRRYGLSYGLPAYVLAAYVGYERLANDYHYPLDIVAGAAIGYFSASLYTTQYRGWDIQPVIQSGAFGIKMSREF